jgi:hypothetical protein
MHGRGFRGVVIALLISLAGTAISAAAAGESLGLVIGGLFAAALLTPPLTCGLPTLTERMTTSLAISVGISAVWLCLLAKATGSQVAMLDAMVLGQACLLAAVVAILEAACVHRMLAAALGVVIATCWLTWPVWLSAAMTQPEFRSIPLLVQLHPPLVANGILTFTAPWTEQSIAYRMTVLDQDVPLRLPVSAWPCVSFEVVAATAMLAVSYFIKMFYMPKAKPVDMRPTDRPAPQSPAVQ